MKALKIFWITAILSFTTGCAGSHQEQSHKHSSYEGQEKRAIKALSETDVASYLNGEGMGLAKAAELNGFPGPKHILDNEAGLSLSAEQKEGVRKSFEKMKNRAVELGRQIVEKEKELDELFRQNKIDEAILREKTQNIAKLQGELRSIHLQAHLEMKKILSPQQVDKYNQLRGYKN